MTTPPSCIYSGAEFFGETSKITQETQFPYSPDLVSYNFWLFPKLKLPLKGKRFQFQTTDEIQENTKGQLMAIGRTVWGPKVPTLKGTGASLSYVKYFLYLLSSSINVSIFQITWLDTCWTDLIIPSLLSQLECYLYNFISIIYTPNCYKTVIAVIFSQYATRIFRTCNTWLRSQGHWSLFLYIVKKIKK